MSDPPQKVSLSVPQLVAIILALVGVGLWNVKTGWDMENRISEKIDSTRKELKADIQSVQDGIPPDWFRKMVERNAAQIDELRKRIMELQE